MEIVNLTKEQVETIYNTYMVRDFPKNERKPLSGILKSLEKGAYECLGITENGSLVGYAFFVKSGEDYMLEYFAVPEDLRSQGIGSRILKEISIYCYEKNSLICEVENPSYARNEEDRNLQESRKNFYMRNGFIDTGVDVKTFGVEYRLLEMPFSGAHTPDEIRKFYEKHYRAYLPNAMYTLMIHIR